MRMESFAAAYFMWLSCSNCRPNEMAVEVLSSVISLHPELPRYKHSGALCHSWKTPKFLKPSSASGNGLLSPGHEAQAFVAV